MFFLYAATTPFLKVLNFVIDLLTLIYQTISYFGFILFTILCWTLNALSNSVIYIISGINVLVEDFGTFLVEVYSTFLDCGELFFKSIETIVFFVFHVYLYIKETFYLIYEGVINQDLVMKEETIVQMQKPIFLVKDAVLLIGYWVWTISNFILDILLYLNRAPYIVILFITKWLDKIITELPYESICGLLILSIMVYSAYKLNPNIMTDSKKYLYIFYTNINYTVIYTIMNAGLILLISVHKSLKFGKYLLSGAKNLLSGAKDLLKYRKNTQNRTASERELERERICVICMDRKRNTMFLNCRHLCACSTCAYTISVETGECPICRMEIIDVMTVYT